MRIAVSGTHGSGKSTLIEDFLAAHPEYVHEPEPYEWLAEMYGESISDPPTAEDFSRQLDVSVERLAQYGADARVIVERSPLDFLAYLLALVDLGRSGRDCALVASAGERVAVGMSHIDLFVLLPLDERARIDVPDSEDLELRQEVNDRLLDLVGGDAYSLFTQGRTRVVEIHGSRAERLQQLERAARLR